MKITKNETTKTINIDHESHKNYRRHIKNIAFDQIHKIKRIIKNKLEASISTSLM